MSSARHCFSNSAMRAWYFFTAAGDQSTVKSLARSMRGISSLVKGCSVARHVQKDSLSVSSFGREKAAFAVGGKRATLLRRAARRFSLWGPCSPKVTRAGDRRKTNRRRLIRLFDYANAALSDKLFDSVDKETVGSDQNTAAVRARRKTRPAPRGRAGACPCRARR